MDSAHRRYVADYLTQSVAATTAFANDAALQDVLFTMAEHTVAAFRAGRKLLIAGNGGSAADAQHIAAEFTGRLMYDRAPLPAIALTTDSSALTAIGNDYGFDRVFERQVRALGQAGDILIAISTSGNSPNIRLAIAAAKDNGVICYGFTGPDGGAMAQECDLVFRAPGAATAFVQQVHITAAHIYCALIERSLFPKQDAAAA